METLRIMKFNLIKTGFFVAIVPFLLYQSCTGSKESEVIVPTVQEEPTIEHAETAIEVRNQFLQKDGVQIAYRKLGQGPAMILCNRFRGTLDDWDPLFLDELAKNFTVITFDYTGIGLSTPNSPTDSLRELKDISDLTSHLKIDKFVLVGWSHGGKVAQSYTSKNPSRISHLILLGTGPIGKNKWNPEPVFFERALKPVNDQEDEVILFFEPRYPASVAAAQASHERMAARKTDRDIYVTPDRFEKYFQSVSNYNADEEGKKRLESLGIPILVVSGEHDIVFPIESWYEQTRVNPNLQILMLPQAGHGPQSQYPILTAGYIKNFIDHKN